MADILISENIVGEEMDRLRSEFSTIYEPELWRDPERFGQILSGVRGVIVRNQTRLTRELIVSSPNLQVIGRA